ncbi:MAG: ubiquitin-like domain-containing protein [Candidatus Hodarchaeota archaeon]
MGFDDEFDDEFDEKEFDEDLEDLNEDLDDDFDEEMEEIIEEPFVEITKEEVESKTPSTRTIQEGKKISVYFMSTIGPGEKKQKLTVNDANMVGDIKETVANLFGLDPADFYLSCGGVTMDETNPLSFYNVSDGDDILLIPASIAG